MSSNLNGRVDALEHQQESDGNAAPITDAERERWLQDLLDFYEARGWRPTGEIGPTGELTADRRCAVMLQVMVRMAERVAKEDPTPETLADAERWRERQARFDAAPGPGEGR